MWYIILSIIFVIGCAILLSIKLEDAFLGIMLSVAFGMLLCLLGGLFVIPATSGLFPNYSEGERNGYITKISKEGIVWKTYEGEMQIGTGQMASLQEPFKFSVVDQRILDKVRQYAGTGERVKVKYTRWLLMPFHIGSSGYKIIEIELFEEKAER